MKNKLLFLSLAVMFFAMHSCKKEITKPVTSNSINTRAYDSTGINPALIDTFPYADALYYIDGSSGANNYVEVDQVLYPSWEGIKHTLIGFPDTFDVQIFTNDSEFEDYLQSHSELSAIYDRREIGLALAEYVEVNDIEQNYPDVIDQIEAIRAQWEEVGIQDWDWDDLVYGKTDLVGTTFLFNNDNWTGFMFFFSFFRPSFSSGVNDKASSASYVGTSGLFQHSWFRGRSLWMYYQNKDLNIRLAPYGFNNIASSAM